MSIWKRAPKFKTLSAEVLELKVPRAPGTYLLAKRYLKRLTEHFGEMRVSAITELEWGRYVSECKERQPTRKLQDDKKFMSQVMLLAHRQGFLRNPVRLTIPDRKSEVGREITSEEITRLFAAAGCLKRAPGRLRFQMEIALKTGMRLREMLHLQWDRISWEEKTIRLRPEDTKTRKGRVIPIAPELLDQLKSRHAKSRSLYVFPSRFDLNRPQNENKTAWRALRPRAVVKCRWHDLRHTCASRLLRRGIPTSVASKYLGMTEAVLIGIYQHLNLDDLRTAAAAMSEAWRAPK